jgi:hypothetical protein
VACLRLFLVREVLSKIRILNSTLTHTCMWLLRARILWFFTTCHLPPCPLFAPTWCKPPLRLLHRPSPPSTLSVPTITQRAPEGVPSRRPTPGRLRSISSRSSPTSLLRSRARRLRPSAFDVDCRRRPLQSRATLDSRSIRTSSGLCRAKVRLTCYTCCAGPCVGVYPN